MRPRHELDAHQRRLCAHDLGHDLQPGGSSRHVAPALTVRRPGPGAGPSPGTPCMQLVLDTTPLAAQLLARTALLTHSSNASQQLPRSCIVQPSPC